MSYAFVTSHRSMVFDGVRNAGYLAAIERYVTPDSVVLDLGCGLGIHGLMAARAGARRVFMVDPEIIVHSALEVAKHNGYGDRVEAFQGRIEEIELPEKVDVIISVFTGNLLHSEDLLPSLFFARDKWLKPGGRLVPDAAELMLAPIAAPTLFDQHVAAWSKPHLGFDYSPLRRYAANVFSGERDASDRALLAAPQRLISADFHSETDTDINGTVTIDVDRDGDCHGLQAWLRIKLGESWLDAGPILPTMHWTPQTLFFDQPLAVRAGDRIEAHLHRPAFGEWTWSVKAPLGQRRQSTFLGQPLSASRLSALSESAKVRRSSRGDEAYFVLERMTGGQSNRVIADELRSQFPLRFVDGKDAMRYVTSLAGAYGS